MGYVCVDFRVTNQDQHILHSSNALIWCGSHKKEEITETSVLLSLDYSFAFKPPSLSTSHNKVAEVVFIAKLLPVL
jgi:hypothetical protein